MKRIIFSLSLLAALAACKNQEGQKTDNQTTTSIDAASKTQPEGGYLISGQLDGLADGTMYLLSSQVKGAIDSCSAKGGKFAFAGKMATPTHVAIAIKGQVPFLDLYLENTKMEIAGKMADLQNVSMKGSSVNDEFRKLMVPILAASNDLNKESMQVNGQDPKAVAEFQAKVSKMYQEWTPKVKEYIKTNPTSPISAYAATAVLFRDPSLANNLESVKKLLKELPEQVTQAPELQQIKQAVAQAEAQEAQMAEANAEIEKRLPNGGIAPDFTQNDVDGKPLKLSSLRGKYVLVDFWASWCRPCRQENPNVVAAYNRFKNKNFEILGVSLDQAKEPWLQAIKDDGLTWKHVSDLQFWNNAAAKMYGVTSVPFNILLDPKGKIIAKNLRGGALTQKLEQVLK